MAKKRTPVKAPEPPKAPRCCFRCDGTCEVCTRCGESANFCDGLTCAEEDESMAEMMACPDCGGAGK